MSKRRGKQHLKRHAPADARVKKLPKRVNVYEFAVTVDDPKRGPSLRVACEPVERVNQEIFLLCSRMIYATEHDPNCRGLAAPQIGANVRIFTVKDEDSRVYCFVNPTVEALPGSLRISEYEGCFSFPDLRVLVERDSSVVVRGLTVTNEASEVTFRGMAARAAQHEMEHLDGVMIDSYGELEPVPSHRVISQA